MPLNQLIPLMGQQPTFSLFDLGQTMRTGQQLQAGQLALSEEQRQLAEAEAIRQAYRQQYGGGAPAGLAGALPMAPAAAAGGGAETFPPLAEQEAASTHKALYGALPPGYDPAGTAPPPSGLAGQAPAPSGLAGLGGQRGGGMPPAGGAPGGLGQHRDFINTLYTISPAAGREAEKHAYTSQDLQMKQHLERVEYLGRIADGVLDADTQEAYDVGRRMLIEAGMPESQMPPVYDRSLMQMYSGVARDSRDTLQLAQARLSESQAQREKSKAPDYGFSDAVNEALYARYGTQIPPGTAPTPAMVQQARADVQAADPTRRLNIARARREEAETEALEDVQALEPGGKRMTERDIADAMKQTGRSRQEVIDAAKAKGYRLPGEQAPAPAATHSAAPTTAPPAAPPAAPARVPAAGAPAAPATAPAPAPARAPAPAPVSQQGAAATPAAESPRVQADVQRLKRLEDLRDQQEQHIERLRPYATSDAGGKRLSQAERELDRRNTEIERLKTRMTPSTEVRDELLAMGVAPEAATPTQLQQAQATIQQRKERTGIERELDKPLSTEDAALYGVPPGTTGRELNEMARGARPPIAGTLPPLKGEAAKTYQMGARMNRGQDVVAALEAQGVTGTPFYNTLEQTVDTLTGALGTVVGVASGGGWPGAAGGGALGLGVGNLASPLVNKLRSPEERRYLMAQLAFIAGILRKESGAAITAEEYKQYGKIYFPQSSDDAETIAAKRAMRQGEIDSLQEQFPNRPFPRAPEIARSGVKLPTPVP